MTNLGGISLRFGGGHRVATAAADRLVLLLRNQLARDVKLVALGLIPVPRAVLGPGFPGPVALASDPKGLGQILARRAFGVLLPGVLKTRANRNDTRAHRPRTNESTAIYRSNTG